MREWQLYEIRNTCKSWGTVTLTMLYHYCYGNFQEVITLPCGCDKLCDSYKLGDAHWSTAIPLENLQEFLNYDFLNHKSSNSVTGMFQNLENYIDRL